MMTFGPQEQDVGVPTPEQIARAVDWLKAFYPAEWGGTAGITEAEARCVARGMLKAALTSSKATSDA